MTVNYETKRTIGGFAVFRDGVLLETFKGKGARQKADEFVIQNVESLSDSLEENPKQRGGGRGGRS